jgi:hypothetical protein
LGEKIFHETRSIMSSLAKFHKFMRTPSVLNKIKFNSTTI